MSSLGVCVRDTLLVLSDVAGYNQLEQTVSRKQYEHKLMTTQPVEAHDLGVDSACVPSAL